jgi:hypothetical protein
MVRPLLVPERRLRHPLQWHRPPARHQLAGLRRACRAAQGLGGGRSRQLHKFPGTGLRAGRAGDPVRPRLAGGTLTFDDVADFGPGILQPAVGIWGGYRVVAPTAVADVQPNTTVSGGSLLISGGSGIDSMGTGKVSWMVLHRPAGWVSLQCLARGDSREE